MIKHQLQTRLLKPHAAIKVFSTDILLFIFIVNINKPDE